MAIDTVTVERAGEIIGCRRSKVFELLATGDLEGPQRIGRARMIFRASVDRFLLTGLERESGRKRRAPLPEPCRREDFSDLLR